MPCLDFGARRVVTALVIALWTCAEGLGVGWANVLDLSATAGISRAACDAQKRHAVELSADVRGHVRAIRPTKSSSSSLSR